MPRDSRVAPWRLVLLLVFGLAGASACGDGPPGRDPGEPSDVYPAFAPTGPQVVGDRSTVLASPHVRAVTFTSDPIEEHAEEVVSHLGDPAYWAATAQYSVGPLTVDAPIRIGDPAPDKLDPSQVEAWVQSRFDGSHPEFGAPDPMTIYAVFFPVTTTLLEESMPWCGGYHSATSVNGVPIVYGVIADCTSPPSDAVFASIDFIASHEVAEAASDPCTGGSCRGFSVDYDHYAWQYLNSLNSTPGDVVLGGEIGDLCEGWDNGYTIPGTLFDVQRLWSNASMLEGHDPCVPRSPETPYFNSMPVLPDDIDFPVGHGTLVHTKGLQVPYGQTRVVELDLYSDADTHAPWFLRFSTLDLDLSGFGNTPHLRIAADRSTGQNGEKIYLSITRKSQGTAGTIVFVVSTLGSTQVVWPFAVSP